MVEGCGFPLGKHHTPLSSNAYCMLTLAFHCRGWALFELQCTSSEAVTPYASSGDNGRGSSEETRKERWGTGLCLVIDGGAVGKLLPVSVVCFLRDIVLDSNSPFHLTLYYCLFEYLTLLFECL